MTENTKDQASNQNSSKPRIGVALGGGVARGFSHIGALKALVRHGIEPTIVAGTSFGALVGGCYLAGKLDILETWGRSLTSLKTLTYLDFKVKGSGIIGGKRLRRLMEDQLGDINIEDLPHPFTAVATDLVTGHEVWLRKGNLVDAMVASFSLPGLFPPVEKNNRFLIDGALVNPVPVSVCQAFGARMTIAVDLNADLIGKATQKGERVPRVMGYDLLDEEGMSESNKRKIKSSPIKSSIFKREDKSQPSLFGIMISSLGIIQDRITRSRLAGDPPDIHIKPHVGHIGLMEFQRAEELIAEGEAAVERALPDILAAQSVFSYSEDDGSVY